MVVYTNIFNIFNFTVFDIEAELAISVIFGIHGGDHLVGVETGVVGEDTRNDLEGIGEFDVSVPVQSFDMIGLGLQSTGELDLSGTGTWAESTVLGHALVDVDSIINGSLDIIEGVLRVASEDNGPEPALEGGLRRSVISSSP